MAWAIIDDGSPKLSTDSMGDGVTQSAERTPAPDAPGPPARDPRAADPDDMPALTDLLDPSGLEGLDDLSSLDAADLPPPPPQPEREDRPTPDPRKLPVMELQERSALYDSDGAASDADPGEIDRNTDRNSGQWVVDKRFVPGDDLKPDPPKKGELRLQSLSGLSRKLDYKCAAENSETLNCRIALLTVEPMIATPKSSKALSRIDFYHTESFANCNSVAPFYGRFAAAEEGEGDPVFGPMVEDAEKKPLGQLRALAAEHKSYCEAPSPGAMEKARDLVRGQEAHTCSVSQAAIDRPFKKISPTVWESPLKTGDPCGSEITLRFAYDPLRKAWSFDYDVTVPNPDKNTGGTACLGTHDRLDRYTIDTLPTYTACDWVTFDMPSSPPEPPETGTGAMDALNLSGRAAHLNFRCTASEGKMSCGLATMKVERATKAWPDKTLNAKIAEQMKALTANCPRGPVLLQEWQALQDGSVTVRTEQSFAHKLRQSRDAMEALSKAQQRWCETKTADAKKALSKLVSERVRGACVVRSSTTKRTFRAEATRWAYRSLPAGDSCGASEQASFSESADGSKSWMFAHEVRVNNPGETDANDVACGDLEEPLRHYEINRMPAWTGCTYVVFE